MRLASILIVATLALSTSVARAAERQEARVITDTPIYRSADARSQVLGKLSSGKSIQVFLPAKRGFFAVYLTRKIRGARYGWIPAANLQFGTAMVAPPVAVAAPVPSSAPDNEVLRNKLGLFGKYSSFSPKTYLTAVGDSGSGFSNVAVGLSYSHTMGEKWLLEAQIDYLSVTHPLSVQGESFSFSGYELILDIERRLVSKGDFSLWIGAGAGISAMSITSPAFSDPTNNGLETELQSSPVIAFPLVAKLQGRFALPYGFGLMLDAGYELKSFSSIAYSRNANNSINSATLSLSSILVSLGVDYAF